jgi:hypothetical protein
VLSDWAGSLYRFDSELPIGDVQIYQAQDDDLPIHLLESGPDGRLVAATWNGRIRIWDSAGAPAPPSLTTALLPLHLALLADGGLAVADQAGAVRFYDAAGEQTWCWQSNEAIKGVWFCLEEGRPTAIALLGRCRVAKLIPGQPRVEEHRFGTPVESLCLYHGPHEINYLCVARRGGHVDWLSVSPLSVIQGASLGGVPGARYLVGLSWTPLFHSADRVAVGLTADGRIFLVRDNRLVLYPEPTDVNHFLIDPSGRFLLSFSDGEAGLYRNPAVGLVPWRIEKMTVQGSLELDAWKKLTVTLKNSSPVAIHRLKAKLQGAGSIDQSRLETLANEVGPGETFALEFSAKAKIRGSDVPLVLTLTPEDEGGPSTAIELPFTVESRDKGHGD